MATYTETTRFALRKPDAGGLNWDEHINYDIDEIDTILGTHQDKLDNIEEGADVTDAENVGTSIHGAEETTTANDADEMAILDSVNAYTLKRFTWANIKTALKAFFDTLYATIDHNHDSAYAAFNHSHDGVYAPLGAAGGTASRPSTPVTGQMFFDTDLNKPIWYNGTGWVDADGNAV